MKKWIILGVLLMGVVIAGIYGWSEYARKPSGAGELPVSVVMAVDPLIAEFATDEEKATKLYADAVIEVRGIVQEVEPQGAKVNVYLAGSDPMYRVTCEFDASSAPALTAGETVSIKGICAGYTGFDVLLQRCALLNEPS